MPIIKTITDGSIANVVVLSNNSQISIDILSCRDIIFYGFVKEDTTVTFLDGGILVCLSDGSTTSFTNVDERFNKYKSISISFVARDSIECSYLIDTKALLKFYLSNFFKYKKI